MRGLKSTIALVVVLVGLGAYIYFVTWKQPDAGADTGKKQEKVFASLDSSKIEEVKVTSAAGERVSSSLAPSGSGVPHCSLSPSKASSASCSLRRLPSARPSSVVCSDARSRLRIAVPPGIRSPALPSCR